MGRLASLCFVILSLILACGLLGGCSGSATYEEGQDSAAVLDKPEPMGKGISSEGPSAQCNLIVNDSWRIGACDVYNEGRYLHVVFGTEGTWTMTDARVYADTVPPEGEPEYQHDPVLPAAPAPPPSGSPLSDDPVLLEVTGSVQAAAKPHFVHPLPYEREQLDGSRSLHLVFDIGELAPGGTIYIMADAGVKEYAGSTNTHTAFARRPSAPDEDIIEYEVLPTLELPAGELSGYVHFGASSTYQATVIDCPPGYDVEPNTPYPAWCVDLYHHITPGHMYTVTLYNSLDPELPTALQDDDWDMVNYLLNHRQGVYQALQNAIWYFVGGGGYPSAPDAQAMVEDALENGEGFVPGLNEQVAVIMYPGPETQVTIFEVELEPTLTE